MIIYSALMFAAALLFLGFAVTIYKGNTNLIHAYHQTHVNEADQKRYGQSFSKGLFLLAGSLIFSGVIALLGSAVPIVIISIGVLFAGIVISFMVIAKVQKEFNGGFF